MTRVFTDQKVSDMNYIVLDLEWNQSPSGKNYSNKNLPFEIVEIGAVKLNSYFKEVGRFSELVRPRVYKNINHIISNIIHIEEAELRKARSFKEVMQSFLEFCGTNYIFCTWGNLDLLELQRNMKYFGLKPLSAGPVCFIDVQKIFALQTEGKSTSTHWSMPWITVTLKRISLFTGRLQMLTTQPRYWRVSVENTVKSFPLTHTAFPRQKMRRSGSHLTATTNTFPAVLIPKRMPCRMRKYRSTGVICAKEKPQRLFRGLVQTASIITVLSNAKSMG